MSFGQTSGSRARRALSLVVVAVVLPLVPHDVSRCAVDLGRGWSVALAPPVELSLLLVTLDTTRADRIGAYGDPRAADTPALDRLAREGVLFDDASSPVPLTLPAHCTLLTGQLPPQHGVHENAGRLGDDTPTLATVLAARGYRTAAFVGSQILSRPQGLGRGFAHFDDDIPWPAASPGVRPRRRAAVIVDRALDWIDRTKGSRFFAWLHFYDPHAPYDSAPAFRERYAGRPYEAAIASVDAQIGRLRAFLDRHALTERTVIVVIGDHGEGLGDHGERMHGLFVYQSVLRVPFIIRAPFAGLRGRRVTTPVSGADLMPTVLDLLGAGPVRGVEGRSLVPLITGPAHDDLADVYAENLYPRRRFGWSEMRAIRSGAFKYIEKTHPELYDLDRDRGETHDLSAERPALAARLAGRLRMWEQRLGAASASRDEAPDVPVVGTIRDRLAALGYVAGSVASGPAGPGPVPSDPRSQVEVFNCFAIPSTVPMSSPPQCENLVSAGTRRRQ